MQIITVTADDTVRIELTAYEAKAIRDDPTSPAAREFARYVDFLFGERRTPTFPGGGF
ncbi:hypothetical protein [Streptomyces sp. 1222.5]|uniref:hypothetical protein n=1 Tax=Streptomyces sp. 1222.5 TaxID=1881026 RepID=UPI003EBBC0A7